MRDAPSGTQIGSLHAGDAVTTVGEAVDGWQKIKFGSGTGHVSVAYLSATKPSSGSETGNSGSGSGTGGSDTGGSGPSGSDPGSSDSGGSGGSGTGGSGGSAGSGTGGSGSGGTGGSGGSGGSGTGGSGSGGSGGSGPVVTTKQYTEDQPIAQPADQTVQNADMEVGTTKVVQQGRAGTKRVTYEQTYKDGVPSGSPKVVSTQVVKDALPTITHVGTKPKPTPKPTWSYDGGKAGAVAAAVNAYRTSNGKSSLPASGSQSMGVDTPASVHAWGYSDAGSIVAAWAASPEHRIAMLDDWNTRIVCGYWTLSDGSQGPYSSCEFG